MRYSYKTKGTCAQQVDFDINENNIISNVSFVGGCNGNLNAISRLVEGMPADKVASMLEGNICGTKSTSCADQFSIALKEAINCVS